ncbi:hypothetical protein AB1Y20_008786 [Prymnesium parvum]|uniref:Uncharacterized protein n=1 Tax=Prymnesium parvum TaxID=97485 RepID=A0AB34ISM9_PRYPA
MLPSEQKEWADLVETVFNQGDKMEAPADWKPDKNGRILKPMLDAYWMPGRSKEDYDTIGKAIQSWDGEGQKDNLRKDRLRQHQQYFSGTKQKKTGALTARICSCLGAVARLVKRGALLRRALDQARDCEEPPSVQQRFDLAQEELKQVKVELGEREKELLHHTTTAAKRVEDAHRKLKKRGRQQREQAALKAKESVKSHKTKLKAQNAERIKEARARLVEDARVKAQKEVSAQAEELKRRLAMARARARQTEAAAKLSGKRLKRAQGAERCCVRNCEGRRRRG